MLNTLLPFLLCLPTGDQAALHPSEACAYFAAPEISATRSSYDNAPVRSLLRDEDLNNLIGKVIGMDGESFDLEGLVFGELAEGLDQAPPEAQAAVGLLNDLEAFSVSLSGPSFANYKEEFAGGVDVIDMVAMQYLTECGFYLVLDFKSNEAALEARGLIEDVLGFIPNELTKQAPLVVGGAEGVVQTYRWSEPVPLPEPWSAACDSLLVFGYGTTSPDRIRARRPPAREARRARSADSRATRRRGASSPTRP